MALVQALRRRGLPLPVVLMSGHSDVPLAVQRMNAKVADYIEKFLKDAMTLDAVEAALAGHAPPANAETVHQVA